jgi:hypothetical protein
MASAQSGESSEQGIVAAFCKKQNALSLEGEG